MGKLVQDNFSPEIKKFINDYQDIAKEYKNRFSRFKWRRKFLWPICKLLNRGCNTK